MQIGKEFVTFYSKEIFGGWHYGAITFRFLVAGISSWMSRVVEVTRGFFTVELTVATTSGLISESKRPC